MTTLEKQEPISDLWIEETFVCDSCETELALEQRCDHDPKTVHLFCIDCCQNLDTNNEYRDDLD